ncbi:hypothetical protein SAMN05421505_102145 [Sinosporangium album]|uniref:Uncharacterized protein n=1 Tax=Sinosporangium album TaxID=504805 RepID=A0A1G7S2V0_9ACTN|nr:hypothetical protein SAMN05421505_102145 [Sinosporangium album]
MVRKSPSASPVGLSAPRAGCHPASRLTGGEGTGTLHFDSHLGVRPCTGVGSTRGEPAPVAMSANSRSPPPGIPFQWIKVADQALCSALCRDTRISTEPTLENRLENLTAPTFLTMREFSRPHHRRRTRPAPGKTRMMSESGKEFRSIYASNAVIHETASQVGEIHPEIDPISGNSLRTPGKSPCSPRGHKGRPLHPFGSGLRNRERDINSNVRCRPPEQLRRKFSGSGPTHQPGNR